MTKLNTLIAICALVFAINANAESGHDHHHGEGHKCDHAPGEACSHDHHGKDHAKPASTDEKSEFRQKIDGQLDQIETQLTELKSKTATASAEAKTGLESRIAKLERRRTEIKADLDKMSATSGRAWTKFKAGLQKAVNELESGYKEAKTEFDKKEAKK